MSQSATDSDSDSESVDAEQQRQVQEKKDREKKDKRKVFNKNRADKRKQIRLNQAQTKPSRKAHAKARSKIGGPENYLLARLQCDYLKWERRCKGSITQKRRDDWFRRTAQQLKEYQLAYESGETLKQRFRNFNKNAEQQVRREKKKKQKKKKEEEEEEDRQTYT